MQLYFFLAHRILFFIDEDFHEIIKVKGFKIKALLKKLTVLVS